MQKRWEETRLTCIDGIARESTEPPHGVEPFRPPNSRVLTGSEDVESHGS
jgi:hypothetical protein